MTKFLGKVSIVAMLVESSREMTQFPPRSEARAVKRSIFTAPTLLSSRRGNDQGRFLSTDFPYLLVDSPLAALLRTS